MLVRGSNPFMNRVNPLTREYTNANAIKNDKSLGMSTAKRQQREQPFELVDEYDLCNAMREDHLTMKCVMRIA